MLLFRASLAFILSAAVFAAPVFASVIHKKTTATTHTRSGSSSTHRSTASSTRTSSKTTAHKSSRKAGVKSVSTKSRRGTKAAPRKLRGQQAIAPERVTEIQQALIREHYLDGEATGQWDSSTVSAMQKYQSDQGWQTKLTPDSRALKKLGLGPDYSNAINAPGSSFATPRATSQLPPTQIPPAQTAGFAAASGASTVNP